MIKPPVGNVVIKEVKGKYYYVSSDLFGGPAVEVSEEFYNAFQKEFSGSKPLSFVIMDEQETLYDYEKRYLGEKLDSRIKKRNQ